VLRRWNQTGQKFAGEPDIARTFLAEHNEFLWVLIGFTYFWTGSTLARSGFPRLPRSAAAAVSTLLSVVAISFKLAFTNEDAPEQLGVLAHTALSLTPGGSLVTKARLVFWGIGIAAVHTISSELFFDRRRNPGFRNSEIPYSLPDPVH
jgi:ethanolaminephosphotransferase